ncbi:ribitol-5-phosphate dehydrogenase [Latilactobacillus curvatus]|uniref:Ribitol-5-phosphate dehydrogenase n=1 Tax=Latilactobacillus curvatus TaxID=28038 RepID=A0AAC9XZS3_LATCU|nr:alcohol dehydrogenase catalytic domain-containing protein [Latilactobacillus curvatus]ASN59594.1 ribitol-5-phosphate dehydrogenase [Latilactobacillus curvatus]QEA48562.1 ribitol-5-phosphate dehydrogenase [Latilactobacillus curvatus]
MLKQIYRLVSEKKFESVVVSQHPQKNQIVVRPNYLSICHADQRYFNFERGSEIMAKKLPMALVHEGMGTIVYSKSDKFKAGDRVVIVPTVNPHKEVTYGENYLVDSSFMSSSRDGMMQEYLVLDEEQIVKLTDDIPNTIAAFIEMMSVGRHSIERIFDIAKNTNGSIGIWGDGNVSYMTAAVLKELKPELKIYVFGHHQSKLDYYSFVDGTYLTDSIPDTLMLDNAIEATGGSGCAMAIRQIIDHINPEGTVALLGVSELEVPINTRMVLQKGLRLIGSSRSSVSDFKNIVELLHNNPQLISRMGILVNQVINVKTVEEAAKVFSEDQANSFGKTIMEWNV